MSITTASVLIAASRLVWKAVEAWACSTGERIGEWRGKLIAEAIEKDKWKVGQYDADPCRLWVPAVGLEYSFAGGMWESDGPSIPWVGERVLRCRRSDFLRSGFLHDFAYMTAGVYARDPEDPSWSWVPVRQETADVLLRVGVNAEGATQGQETAIYDAVRAFGVHAWERCRSKCC